MTKSNSELSERVRKSLGARLLALLRRSGMSQRAVAAKVGCPRYRIGRYERGENCPPLVVLLTLRKVFHVPLDYLVTGVSFGQVRDTRLLARLRALDELPPERIERIVRLIDTQLDDAQQASLPTAVTP